MIAKTGSLQLCECHERSMDQDMLEDLMMEDHATSLKQELLQNIIANRIWIAMDKTRYRVEDMTSQHIRNVINCFEKKGKAKISSKYLGGKKLWLEIFNKELLSRQ